MAQAERVFSWAVGACQIGEADTAFDSSLYAVGIGPEVLKRRAIMSTANTLHKHELHVVFEEDEDARISWSVETDKSIEGILDISCEELVEAGVPLAALGIKVLHELLTEQMIELALNKADNYRWRDLLQRIQDATDDGPMQLEEPELRAVH